MSTINHSGRGSGPSGLVLAVEVVILLALLFFLGLIIYKHASVLTPPAPADQTLSDPDVTPVPPSGTTPPAENSPEPTEQPQPTPTPMPAFSPYCTEETDPDKYIKLTGINVDGVTLGENESYEAKYPIDFTYGEDYTDVNGIITFRGNNFRDGGSYGYANLTEYKFGESWYKTTGTLVHNGAVWTGSGWTGQPLIVKWPAETKAVMNMYDWAKADDDLVEVIYATMDGSIYFLDLETGQATRPALELGYCFKGAGALDPRGYPILYIGSGYDSDLGVSHAFIISLIDFEILYEFGRMDSFSLRGELCYFDSSALVDAETDQLIYPGENGILYIMKLNTEYDPEAGTLSINPSDVVKWHYYGQRTSLQSYWVGVEGSAAIWQGYIFMCDNGGNLMCLDLNTLELVWVQNTLDDTNVSPVLSIEGGHPYLYLGTSFHLGWRSWTTCNVPIWKIDAENGEIVWQTEYNCYSESGVSGGIQSTVALGKNDLEGYLYVTVSKTDQYNNGVLVCLDRETGQVVWEHHAYYTWSSPVLVYNEDGSGVLVYCTYGNTLYMMDALTGDVLDTFNLMGGVEATPAVYENTLVIGTRQCRIWGIKMK
ncbi:MAG: PQQ-binding-like beta-propeller repeat protein [Oscillospiraceae bacterium]